jgi:hypothetical protein
MDSSRVRRLAADGRLPARKVGHDWVFDADLLGSAPQIKRGRGRPFAAENALGILFLASGVKADWLRPHVRARLQRLASSAVLKLLPRLRLRAERTSYLAPDSIVRRLARDRKFVLSGVSGSEEHGMRLASSNVLEGYIDEGRLRELEYRYALEPIAEQSANLIVHAIDGALLPESRVMPRAVVAADLADSADERSRRVGEQLLRERP